MKFPENNVYSGLIKKFANLNLHRKMRSGRYEPGTQITYKIKSVITSMETEASLEIVKFVGGGFAGQVYQVKITSLNNPQAVPDLSIGNRYAMKILIPPSGFSRIFRDLLYWIGFQGPFQLQVNPTASRAGALWQKFIRRAAGVKLGSENTVVDIYATLIDNQLGSCGELSEWIEGRTWLLEVNDQVNLQRKWIKNAELDPANTQTPEFIEKYKFMHDFVDLLHEVGAHEFARQYKWSTLKSQPNCLRRKNAQSEPYGGLTAVDFRAGLALLPLLPMSPGDFELIIQGLLRGSLVQFDRGNLRTMEKFIIDHSAEFEDLEGAFQELKNADKVYRNSLLDITHNHFKIFFSSFLWKTILQNSLNGWKVQNLVDEEAHKKINNKFALIFIFYILNFIPFLGKVFTKFCFHKSWRKHYFGILFNFFYLKRTYRGLTLEILIRWHRQDRIDNDKLDKLSHKPLKMLLHYPLSLLPAGLHRFFSDIDFFKEKFHYIFIRPLRLYFDSKLREDWLRDMLLEGRKKHMLSDEDSKIIENQINEPYIQKYLKSLAVHICTVPVTQVVSILLAIIYVYTHPDLPRAQAWGIGVGIIALFQIIPISPGSLVRGLYVLYLVIKERDFKNYNIAVFLGFFKYIGYLAFPIQMTYRYPALARFMAGHWATEAIHIIPVFGERGALPEHWVFDLFYNWPLTIRRQMTERAELRSRQKPRYWHIFFVYLFATALLAGYDYMFSYSSLNIPTMKEMWWANIIIPFGIGSLVTLGAKGASLGHRILMTVITAIATGLSSAYISYILNQDIHLISEMVWSLFIFGVLATVSTVFTEINLGEPKEL